MAGLEQIVADLEQVQEEGELEGEDRRAQQLELAYRNLTWDVFRKFGIMLPTL